MHDRPAARGGRVYVCPPVARKLVVPRLGLERAPTAQHSRQGGRVTHRRLRLHQLGLQLELRPPWPLLELQYAPRRLRSFLVQEHGCSV